MAGSRRELNRIAHLILVAQQAVDRAQMTLGIHHETLKKYKQAFSVELNKDIPNAADHIQAVEPLARFLRERDGNLEV